ncbi:MAG: hypothetical protein ABFR75_11665 [Acidobacteriota bacterium]
MKKILLFILLILISFLAQGKVVASLEEISQPKMMSLSKDYLLITEGSSIFVYSMKDFSLVKKFGKEGEGPKEFKVSPFGPPMIAYFYKGNIFVSSNSKISYFTAKGEFIKEMRTMPFIVFRPFHDLYVATGTTVNDKKETVLTVNIHNQKLEKVREIYQSDMSVGPNASFSYPMNTFNFEPYKDNLYLVRGKDGFVIDVMTKEGKKLYTIKKDYEEIKVTKEYRDKTFQNFKTDPNFKQFFDYFKQRIKFKDTYPAIQDIRVTDDRIYVTTFKKKNMETECIILDLKGNEVKRVFVPYPELYGMDYLPEYDIYNKKFYILIENDDDEVWELHVMDL